ncbi:MAG: fibronectin type III domain-containing protein [Clostridia bacterium]|nr:fibronectin type III domain-containing protein [Clostridia bacterium]
MRKHALIRLFALAAFLCLMATSAFAASCTLCGSETGSDDYLCTNCLLALLHQEREVVPLEITSAVQNADGTVTVTWADEAANGPYTVQYELLQSAPVPFGWTAAEGVTEYTCTLNRLVPGVSYVITVVDALGQTAEYTYYAPTPGTDTAIGAKIRFKPMHRIGRSTKQQTAFSASEIAQENETLHGLYLRLTYSTLSRSRTYAFQIAIEAPNDFSDVVFCGTLELHHGKSSVPVWGFIPVDDYFNLLMNYYGGVPTGEYDVTLYFNGQKVYTAPFTVTE